VPFDPQAMILKLDVKLQTPTPTGPPSTRLLIPTLWYPRLPITPLKLFHTSCLSDVNALVYFVVFYHISDLSL
jgi:hypothetical protein